MRTLLYVKGSPRGDLSISAKIATVFLEEYRENNPDTVVDELDLWQEGLPEFDGDSAASKVSFFGEAAMDEKQHAVYQELLRIFHRFNAADDYLFTVPMWNFGLPYKLKQYIDLLSMPQTLFGFDPTIGYFGLLKNKRAAAIYTAAIYSPGIPPAFGIDHTSTHFEDWLRFAGIQDTTRIAYWGSKMLPAPEGRLTQACEDARQAALHFAQPAPAEQGA